MGLPALAVVTLAFPTASASLISYEGTSFPEETGWERSTFCDPERWLENGWLFQHVEVGCGGPPGGAKDRYGRSLAEFAAEDQFFIEWRMQTDGDRSEIDGVAPAALTTGNLFGILYHFTIARDQVRFIRDASIPVLWIDIDPDVPHTYRLELHGADLYLWYIDGDLIDSGVPEGAYPTEDATIHFRAKSWYLESTTQWDYIRYGTIPEPPTLLLMLFCGGVLLHRRCVRS